MTKKPHPQIYARRLQNLRAAMVDAGVGVAVFTPGANMRYLAGYSEEAHERLLCLVVHVDAEPALIVPAINAEMALANPAGMTDVRTWSDADGWMTVLCQSVGEVAHHDEALAIDDEMAARFLVPLIELTGKRDAILAGTLMNPMRAVKDAAEIAAIRRASEITETALRAGRAVCRPGATERDVASAIDEAFRRAGATASFDTIVAAGANSAMPHHMPSSRVIAAGDVVLFDLGALVDDYRGDITRVYRVGDAPDEAYRVYDIVYRAHLAGVATAGPSATGCDVDTAARDLIVDAGYGDRFIHRTGHGLGLDAHEEPNMAQSNHLKLEPGNVFSVEPGIYLPDKFGIRLENIVVVRSDGADLLNGPIESTLDDVSDYGKN